MAKVRLGINQTKVDIPDEMVEQYRSGDLTREHLMQHAIRTNQAEIFDFTQRKTSFLGVAGQSAGTEMARLGSNIRQAAADITGNVEASDAQKEIQSRLETNAERLFRERPVAAFTGQVGPYFAVPGGKVAQTIAGGVQGALEGDTLMGRLGGAALGAGLGFAGQYLGDKAGRFVRRQAGNLFRFVKEPARETLERLGIPMTIGQRTGDPLARFTERLKFVLTNKQPKGEAQTHALNRLVLNFLGEDGDFLSKQARASIDARLGRIFRSAATRAGKTVELDDTLRHTAQALRARADDIQGSERLYRTLIERLDDNAFRGQMDADQFLQLRRDLSAASASKKMDIEVPELVKAIEAMDDQLARIAPDLADDLSLARQQFRVFLATLRGRAIDPEGQLNVNSFDNALNAIFPQFKRGGALPGQARPIGQAVDAMREVIRPFNTSSTAENLATLAFPAGAGLLATGGNPEGAAAGLFGLGLALSGGGAGGLLGGGLMRAPLPIVGSDTNSQVPEYLRRQ